MRTTRRLISNYLSLSGTQAFNYILPLITVPYLVRVLGPEKYGLILFAQSFISYFSILTDYGFALSATRDISVNRHDHAKVSEIVSAVMTIKTLLMILSLIILCLLIFGIERFREDWFIYILTFGTVLGNVLFPKWYFQGIEKMKIIALLDIVTKLIFTVSIFIFIKSANDYIYVPMLNSIGFILVGLVGLFMAIKQSEGVLRVPRKSEIIEQLKKGWRIFISGLAMSVYTTSNNFILGIFTTPLIVGYFGAAEKIILAVRNLINPASQTLYPYFCKLATDSRYKALKILRKMRNFIGAATFFMSLSLFIFAPQIVNLILGPQYEPSIIVIRILSFIPFVIGLSIVYSYFFLLSFGYSKIWSNIYMITCILSLVGAVIFVDLLDLQHIGISINSLCAESFVLLLSLGFYKKISRTIQSYEPKYSEHKL